MTDPERIAFFRSRFPAEGFFQDKEWVHSPRPFALEPAVAATIRQLGGALRRFQRACNRLYLEAAQGGPLAWVAALLDRGKPAAVIELGRHTRWAQALPVVIRPDLILTAEGVTIAEVDSLPGGIGLTAWLNEVYAEMGEPVIGGSSGMLDGFQRAFPEEWIVVSKESADYEPEMRWLAARLADGRQVLNPWSLEPSSLRGRAVYRFFELFDLENVEHSADMLEMARRGELCLTPPPKAFLEEKLWLVLFHAPQLAAFWEAQLAVEDLALLRRCIPQGCVVDPAPLPPAAEIHGLGAADWAEVATMGRREREWVLKISGFSELGWGSRGVHVGHDLSQAEWGGALQRALDSFATHPYLMQRFHTARVVEHPAWDDAAGGALPAPSRVRLCPYYFAGGTDADEVMLGGVLASVCPADKKLLHGMRDAMMLPCVEAEARVDEGAARR